MKGKIKIFRNVLAMVALLLSAALVLLLIILKSDGGMLLPNNGANHTDANRGHVVETKDGKPVDESGIETPYCTLYYPSRWEDGMRTEVRETKNCYQVALYGTVGDKEAWLYTVYFGVPEGDAFFVGALTTEGGATITVCVEMSDFMPSGSWSQEENDTMCAMQESVNHMIARLEEEPAFRVQ